MKINKNRLAENLLFVIYGFALATIIQIIIAMCMN
jgi:hypothetical protein